MKKKLKHLFMLGLFGMISIGASAEEIPNDEIWYTSSDGAVITPQGTIDFGANIISNTYSNGKGIIKYDGNVTSIGYQAFYYCSRLTSVTIPNSVTEIGYEAFYECSGLTSVTIPNSVTEIGYSAFYGCSSLKEPVYNNTIFAFMPTGYKGGYDIPQGILTITIGAFEDCSGLTSVTIPNSVTKIKTYAFRDCSGLTSVRVNWKRPLGISSDVWDGVNKQKCVLYVPEGTWSMYCSAPGWVDFINIEEFSDEPGEEIYLTIMGVNGVILQQAVETEKTYKYLLDNKKNGKIVAVTFNGKDVTADVTDGKYKTPKITGNSEIYVEYDNQPLGDVNLDGKVNVNDITKTADIILSQSKEEMETY